MRIRSIKPEFWRSQDISVLEIEDRLLFIGLWSYVDDNGVGEDRVSRIAADLFADDLERNPSETFARVSRGLSRLSGGGLIVRYSVNNRDYLEIVNWLKHQRIDKPGKARLPSVSAEDAIIREDSRDTRETLASGSGIREQGTGDQGTEEQGVSEIEISRPDVEHLLDLLDSEIERNGSKKPSRNKSNIDAARLLLDKDGYTVQQIEWVIRWSQNNEFWRSNILSMSKLREKFDQLKLQSQRKDKKENSKSEQAHSFIERLQNIDESSGSWKTTNDHLQLRQ